MSSPTDPARKAVRAARLSQALSWLAAAIGTGFVIVFLAQAGLFESLLPKSLPPPVAVEPDRITAGASTVTGIDDQKQPYQVTATRGWQDGATPNIVHLDKPVGEFHRSTGARLHITATSGLYDTALKTLDLAGNVVLNQESRFTATMEKARITVKEKKLTADVPVTASFASGTVNANGMQITDDDGRILFLNGVKARFGAPEGKGDINP